jgi:hypothetical protein
MAFLSSGRSVRRLITSQLIPAAASSFAASSDTPTHLEKVTMVRSSPCSSHFALPMGTVQFLSSALADTGNSVPYSSSFSRKTTGSGSVAHGNPLRTLSETQPSWVVLKGERLAREQN